MKVKQFLSGTKWIPGAGYSVGAEVTLSILLPTFRRGRDGMFLRAANSILSQSLNDIELIIVDDASTDGTSALIDDLMEQDARVSCLRHEANVGLPAISEYEAYVKSRGRFIGFAFDDFLFERDSFQNIITAMEKAQLPAAYGRGALRIGNDHRIVLGESKGLDKLQTFNFIANSSVFLRREVIEDVGLYDPHIAASRLCDWDLWRRILKKYPITYLDVFVGQELGANRPDSLGNTYPMYGEAMQEFFDDYRDELLRPKNFPERDVLEMPACASVALQCHIKATERYLSSRRWYSPQPPRDAIEPRKVVSMISDFSAKDLLTWGYNKSPEAAHIHWIDEEIGKFYQASGLFRSDVAIISIGISAEREKKVLDFCRKYKIPLIPFIDENYNHLRPLLSANKAKVDTRRSNFEEAFESGLLKGWAYEENEGGHPSALEIVVDGDVVDTIVAETERADLLDAGIGKGAHAFYFQLPGSLRDGCQHQVEVRWASDHTQLDNSPKTVSVEYNGRDVEHWKSASVDEVRTQLKHYSAVLVTSDALKDKLSALLPEVKFSVARPIFDEVRLKRQRGISRRPSAKSRALRIAVLDGIALNQSIQSELSAMVRSGELDIELRGATRESFGSIEANGSFGVNQGDFGSNLDRWCEWGADIVLIPPQSLHADNYRSAAELLFSLYIGAVPVVADVACFQDWDEQSGVYRVNNLTGAWAAALKKLSNSGERRKALARLEHACSDKFSIKRHEDLLKDILQGVAPLDYFGFVERYRALSNSHD